MNSIRLFGCTENEQQNLTRHLSGTVWQEGRLEELPAAWQENDVWVVCVGQATAYREALLAARTGTTPVKPPKAIVWVPAHAASLPFQEWEQVFRVQIEEESKDGPALLATILRYPQFLDWSERITSLPTAWFDQLRDNPHNLEVDKLPFSKALREELRQEPVMLAWVRTRLGRLAEMHWDILCPSPEELTAWLDTDAADPVLEARVKRVALAREAIVRQLLLLEGMGLIPPERAAAKRSAIGLRPESSQPTWLSTALRWRRSALHGLGELAAVIATQLTGGAILRPSFRSTHRLPDTPDAIPLSLEELIQALQAGEALSLPMDGKWVHLLIEGEDLLIRAGENQVKRFLAFRVEFQRGTESVVILGAAQGIVRVTPEHFRLLRDRHASRFAIFVESEGR